MPPVTHPHVSEIAPLERRSLFANYAPRQTAERSAGVPAGAQGPDLAAVRRDPVAVVMARCYLHQFLARAFDYPASAAWAWLSGADTRAALEAAAAAVETGPGSSLREAAATVAARLTPEAFGTFHDDYVAAIGHAARGSSPINEIEYGELKADPLFQPHRLADLAAFYRAFGMELTDDGGERQDHLAVELEFMAVLAGQEAHALEAGLPDEALAVNLQAQRQFLREHLGRWCPTFARRLEAMVTDGALRAVVGLLLAFVTAECGRAEVPAGAADISLRPADEGASLCESCGLHEALPGSATVPGT